MSFLDLSYKIEHITKGSGDNEKAERSALCVLSCLHSQVHHPEDAVFGMDEQAAAVRMQLQHVDRDTLEVALLDFLQRKRRRMSHLSSKTDSPTHRVFAAGYITRHRLLYLLYTPAVARLAVAAVARCAFPHVDQA